MNVASPPQKEIRLRRAFSFTLSPGVERLLETDADLSRALLLIDDACARQLPQAHQAQIWTLHRVEGRLTSVVLIAPNDDIEDQFGTRYGIECVVGPKLRAASREDRALNVHFVLSQDALCLDEELPINHPLRQFPHLGRGWDFERNRLLPRPQAS